MKNSQLLIIISNDMKKTKLAVGSIRKWKLTDKHYQTI